LQGRAACFLSFFCLKQKKRIKNKIILLRQQASKPATLLRLFKEAKDNKGKF